MLTETPEYSFQGHSYIRVIGDCYTPPLGWKITLLTEHEFQERLDKTDFCRINKSHKSLIKQHFGHLGL